MHWKVFAFVFLATILEATGDAVMRLALHHQSTTGRFFLFLLGATLLALYGASLNLAPVDFATVTGLYVAAVFIAFQITSYIFFRQTPSWSVLIGGMLIVSGAIVIFAGQK